MAIVTNEPAAKEKWLNFLEEIVKEAVNRGVSIQTRFLPHALEHLGNGYEHQRGTCLQGIRVTAGEGEHCRNDHQTCDDGNGRIKDLDSSMRFSSLSLATHHVLASLVKGEVLSPEKIRATTGGIAP